MSNIKVTGDWSVNVVVTGPEIFYCHRLIENICNACLYPNQTSILKTAFTKSNDWTAVLAFTLAQNQQHAILQKNAPCVIIAGNPTDLLRDAWMTSFSDKSHRVVVCTRPVVEVEERAFRSLKCSVFNLPLRPNDETYTTLAFMCAFETMAICNMQNNLPCGIYKLLSTPEVENTIPENLTPLLGGNRPPPQTTYEKIFSCIWKRLNCKNG